jgi:hypothetical protein
MHKRRLRSALPALLAASLTLAAVVPATAQKFARVPNPAPTTDELVREMHQSETDPRLAVENERFNRQISQEMFQLRESLVRDAMNKMNQRRYSGGTTEDYRRIMGDVMAFLVFVMALFGTGWLVRTIMENRRWNRVAGIQTEMHSKLLEKMASSQELLAYMDTEAGKRFLESSPFEVEHKTSPTFPYGRILLSAQAGMVILFVGVALVWLQNQLPDAAQPLLVFGTLGMALGVGLLFSAGLAYSLSKHFGLTPSSQREAQ